MTINGTTDEASDTALGVVDTEVRRTRPLDDKVVVGWTTTIGTEGGQGFDASGSHTFTFRNGKILSLCIVVARRPSGRCGGISRWKS